MTQQVSKAEIELRKEYSKVVEKIESLRQLIFDLHIDNSQLDHAANLLQEVKTYLETVYGQKFINLGKIGNI